MYFLSEEFEEPSCKSIWTRKLSSTLNDKMWENIFRACHKSILDNRLIWFQYKILYNILDTKYYLNKLKIIDSNLCSFCNQQPESIEHLFVHCEFVIDLWKDLKRWIFNKLNILLELTNQRQILGYEELDFHFWPLNFLLTATRYYVYWCSKKIFN